jgi:hypothetical protein
MPVELVDTVAVKSGKHDYSIIRKVDFDPKVHELYAASSEPSATGNPASPSGPASASGSPAAPESIVDLKVEEALLLVQSIENIEEIVELLKAEQMNTHYPSGRKTVIDALQKRLTPKE